jgi:hypothetical protein
MPVSIQNLNSPNTYTKHAHLKCLNTKTDAKMHSRNQIGTTTQSQHTFFYFRPRRERMSLFCNGVVTQRNNSRVRSLGGDHLPGQTNHDVDESNFNVNSPDYHKSSLLSTSTKSTTVDSPPPRCVSFPANLPGRDRDIVFEPNGESGIDNSAYRKDNEDATPRMPNGNATRSFSAGSRYKRNGIIHPMNAPQVTITAEVANENDVAEDTTEYVKNNNEAAHKLHVPSNDCNERTDGPVTTANEPLTTAE